ESAPAELPAIGAAAAGLEAVAAFITDRERSQQRQVVINANPELQERELIKMAALSAAVADALRRRGTAEPAASLIAEIAIAVFKVAFERWLAEGNRRDLAELMRESLDELTAVTAAQRPA